MGTCQWRRGPSLTGALLARRPLRGHDDAVFPRPRYVPAPTRCSARFVPCLHVRCSATQSHRIVTTLRDTRPPFQTHSTPAAPLRNPLAAAVARRLQSQSPRSYECVCLPFAGGWQNGSLIFALRYRHPSGMGGDRRFARRCRGSDAIRSAGCGYCEQSRHTHGGREQPRCRCRPCIQV